jgi:hypothetical protein
MKIISVILLFALLFKADVTDAEYPCTEDVTLIYSVGTYEYTDLPIAILDQNSTKHVQFEVSHTWDIPFSNFFIEYQNPFSGDRVCMSHTDWEGSDIITLTAQCMESVPISVVYLVAMDAMLDDTNNATVPPCCHDSQSNDADDHAVQYTFTLQCAPKNC